jgi:hypothetical protein
MHTVHVRVNDAADGRPTPCRLRFTDAEGRYYAPFGRLTEFAVDQIGVDVGGNVMAGDGKYAYIDGACEIRLPAGPIRVQVHKGFEYKPLDEQVRLSPGKLALRFTLKRWADTRRDRWYSGDDWAEFLTPHAALLEAEAEDLAVVNLLASEALVWGDKRQCRAFPNILAFSGQRPALERPGCLVAVNTLNEHPRLGRLALLNCHRAVYPLAFGGPGGLDDWTLADWCDQCHRKGGLVVGHGFFGTSERHPHGEILPDLVLGKIDALHMNSGFQHPDNPVLEEWHALLNTGLRVPLLGGGGKMDNSAVLGETRTYARLGTGQDFSYKHWIEAVRAGRTVTTNGPLLTFTVNGEDPGTVLELSPSTPGVHVRAEARCLAPFERLEVVWNGEVVAAADAAGSPCQAAVEADLPVPGSGWLAARCWGDYDGDKCDWIGAQSGPVYVTVAEKPLRPTAATVAPFLAKLDKMLEWVAREARCENDQQRQRLAGVFEAARAELLRRQAG